MELSKYSVLHLFLFSLIFLLISVCSVHPETEVYGIIDHNQRWTAEKSPYRITNDVVITEEGRVTVNPGTRIIVDKPVNYPEGIQQLDGLDSATVSIRVYGGFRCIGRQKNRIVFAGRYGESEECSWYGIVLESVYGDGVEIAFTNLINACNGFTIKKGSPILRNSILEFNNTAVKVSDLARPDICNNVIVNNLMSGIVIDRANPVIKNNIIAFNGGNGVVSDGMSKVDMEYNCLYGNNNGNLFNMYPEYGILKEKNKNGDSVDFKGNLYVNPVFAGSKADSGAVEKDLDVKTDKSKLKDPELAKVIHDTLTDSSAVHKMRREYPRYWLSVYSPCRDAGDPDKKFKDEDGSRNDIGIYGGMEFVDYSE